MKKSQGNPLDKHQPEVTLKGRQKFKRPTKLKQVRRWSYAMTQLTALQEVRQFREAAGSSRMAEEQPSSSDPQTQRPPARSEQEPDTIHVDHVLNEKSAELLKTLKRFQDRMHAENPVKVGAAAAVTRPKIWAVSGTC